MLISISENDNRPLYQQIAAQIKEQISKNTLKPGDELPSVRELSDSLGINMHTVRRAYLELRDQGIINLRLGRKAKIASDVNRLTQTDARESINLRIQEAITDALLAGFTANDIRKMIEQYLDD